MRNVIRLAYYFLWLYQKFARWLSLTARVFPSWDVAGLCSRNKLSTLLLLLLQATPPPPYNLLPLFILCCLHGCNVPLRVTTWRNQPRAESRKATESHLLKHQVLLVQSNQLTKNDNNTCDQTHVTLSLNFVFAI